MLILGIDTSGKTASVALLESDIVIAQNTIYTQRTHSQVILPLCKNMLKDAQKGISDADLIAVSNGPGSYTGIRIGISAVKAICFALDKKCVGISTLESLARNMTGFSGYIVPIMKARLDLVYNALFKQNTDSKIERLCSDRIIAKTELYNVLYNINENIILVGDGAEDFFNEYKGSINNLILAPPHLRLQLASSLCLSAMHNPQIDPQELQASYLQPTKAEKDASLR